MKLCFSRHLWTRLNLSTCFFVHRSINVQVVCMGPLDWSPFVQRQLFWSWNDPNSVKMIPTSEKFSLGNQKLKLIGWNKASVCREKAQLCSFLHWSNVINSMQFFLLVGNEVNDENISPVTLQKYFVPQVILAIFVLAIQISESWLS